MTDQYPSPYPPQPRQPKRHGDARSEEVGGEDLASREPPLVISAGDPRLWNGQEWVPAPHLSADGKAWWDGVSWVAVPSQRHRLWGDFALGLAVFIAGYCVPMSMIGIADSRVRSDYTPGLSGTLYPLLLASLAIAVAITSIILDRKEKRRPFRGWLSLAVVGLSMAFLWLLIFAGA
jgi:hypothetical protein